jgi:hypothetical protein
VDSAQRERLRLLIDQASRARLRRADEQLEAERRRERFGTCRGCGVA